MVGTATDGADGKFVQGHRNDQRFGRDRRLTDAASFQQVFDRAKRSRDPLFTVLYRPNGGDTARLGLAIGKRNCRQASGRNRLRRIVRESFRQQRAQLGGIDIVVLNQLAASNATNAQLFASLAGHWRRCMRAGKQSDS